MATHNHFVLDRGGKVFKQSAPVIKLPPEATEDDHLALLGLLNSSTACFWMQQVFHCKGGPGGACSKDEKYHDFYEHDATKLKQFPLPAGRPLSLARRLDGLAQDRAALLPAALVRTTTPTRAGLAAARAEAEAILRTMIALQEELDWICYRLYGLIAEDLTCASAAADPPPLRLGERAFEIALARQVAAGEVSTTWFPRHGSTPLTEIPADWPAAERGVDPTPVIGWAGWTYLQKAQALAGYYIRMKEQEGFSAKKLTPLLAGLRELVPWLRQWHNEIDPAYGVGMGDYFNEFVYEEARGLHLSAESLASWTP
ncbi:MAG: hypothetical protein HYV63_18805 [Candidatus Schekmanbacteria bacterium]|nr:hypothetical protein [Candidatus Schekmanbacteria bacterium]